MQKSQLKGDKKSRGFEKQQPHRHLDIHTVQKSHSNLTWVSDIMGFVRERGVRHLPCWSVGHARQVRRWLNTALPSPSPVVNGGHPSLLPSPGTDPGRSRVCVWGGGGGVDATREVDDDDELMLNVLRCHLTY